MNAFDESLAKIAGPRIRNVYKRESLFNRLDECNEAAAVWISAPAGSGKTTLVSSYLQERDEAVLWYHVDESDADIATTFWYLKQQARSYAPLEHQKLPTFSSAYQGNLVAFGARFFEKLFALLPPGFTLVLDDCHLVKDDGAFFTTVTQAIHQLPGNSRLILISRDVLPSQLCRFLANESLKTLGWTDLQLNPEEFRNIARLRRPDISDELVEHLEDRTDGWAAGLVFGLQQVGTSPAGIPLSAGSQFEDVFGYFANELYLTQEESVRRTVMQLALFPRMTQEMAVELTNNTKAGAMLNWLHRHNYFVNIEVPHVPLYRFHPLFREFLLQRLEMEFSADGLLALRRQAARLLEQNNFSGAALTLYKQTGSDDEVVRLIEGGAAGQFAQGRLAGLEREINLLPEATIAARPWLAYWQGMCRMFFRPTDSHGCFLQSYQGFLEQGDKEGALMAWSGAINSELTEWGDIKVIDHWIDLGEDLFTEEIELSSEAVGAQAMVSMCAGLFLCRPHSPSLEKFARKTHTILTIIEDKTFSLMGANLMLVFYAWQGALPKARLLLESLRPRMAEEGIAEHHQVMWAAVRSWVELITGHTRLSLEIIEEALVLAERTGVSMFDFKFYGMATQACLWLGDYERAEEYLCKYQEVIPAHARLLRFHAHYLDAWLNWSRGDYGAAAEHLVLARGFLEASGSPPIVLAKLVLAESVLAFAINDEATGRKGLDWANGLANRVDSAWLKFQGALLEADQADRAKDRKKCIHHLEVALAIGRIQHLVVTEWWNPQRMSRLMEIALAEGIDPEYARKIISVSGLQPGPLSVDSAHWPWPVTIRMLGGFRLEVDGELVDADTKSKRKVLELLRCLAVCGGSDVPTAKIADALWPSADGDDARNALKTNIHRLRKLLGRHDAIINKAGMLSLNPQVCWADIRAFSNLANTRPAHKDRIRNLRRALELYEGPLLPDEDASWVIRPRSKLQAMEHRIVMELGRRYEERCRWNKAIRIYRKGFDMDSLDEEVASRLMSCYQQSGQESEALAIYEQCRQQLHEQIARQPSRSMRALADRISNS